MGTRSLRARTASFVLAVAFLTLITGVVARPPEASGHSIGHAIVDISLAALLTGSLLFAARVGGERVALLVPFGFILLLAALRHELGGPQSGFATLYLLPLAWIALHRSTRQAIIAIVFVELLMVGPLLIYPGPPYPGEELRRAISLGLVGTALMAMIRLTLGQSVSDPLTGLGNRRAWETAIEEQFSRSTRRREDLSVAILDLDDLKTLNDTRGHAAGDALIVECARSWSETIRPEDLLVRIGGDEFFLMLPAADEAPATEVLERLRSRMPEGQTFSAGIATWDGSETVEALMHRADGALYAAKTSGRGRLVAADVQPAVELSRSA